MNIEDCRKEIDGIDREIVDAFIRRMEVSLEIAEIKKNEGLPIYNESREKEVIARIKSMAQGNFESYAEELYEKIMEISKRIQEEKNK